MVVLLLFKIMENKVKVNIPLSAKTLESSEVSTQALVDREVIETYLSDTLNFVVKYTTGASETNNTCSVTVWGYVGTLVEDSQIKADANNWIQLGEHSITGGVATFAPTTFNVVGAGTDTYIGQFSLDICVPKIRFGALESGVGSNKGTITLIALTQ